MINKRHLILLIVSSITLFFLVFINTKIIYSNDNLFVDLDEVVNYEIFPFSEYEKLIKLEEQEPCKIWGNSVCALLKRLIFQLENSPGRARDDLILLNKLLASPPESEAVSLFEGEESFTAQSVAEVLQSRIAIWYRVLLLLEREQTDGPYGSIPQMSMEDADRLYEKADVIRSSLLASPNGQQWISFFQLTPLHGELGQNKISRNTAPQGTAEPVEKYARDYNALASADMEDIDLAAPGLLSEKESRRISLLVNNVFLMQERASLTADQARLLETPLIRDWLDELPAWRSDPLHPLDLLAAYECYRQYRGTSDSSRLSVLTRQMLGSKNPELQMLGQAVQNEFSHAHLKMYVSNYLINSILPKLEPEYGTVNENMAGQQVVGRRRADTKLYVSLIPDPDRMLMSLNFSGQVVTQTTTSAFPATVYNQSHGTYSATKQVELTSRGILVGPANVTANSRVMLNGVETDLDFVPIIGGLIQGIAKDQYDSQQQQIQADARAKIIAQTKQRVDTEADTRI
ncbi:MAG: Ig-like domain-containing protein, partial [Planctomycetaceae bacterium]|nr:Ig-like domain-containing protein [Planctomycetaceae bacterium]